MKGTTSKKETAAIVGVGAAACAACCAGPILGFLAAIGLGTALGVAAFGAIGLAIAAAITAVLVVRRRRRAVTCSTSAVPTAVEMSQTPTRR